MERKYFILCLVFASWTIVQTSLHLVGVIYAYYMSTCEETPTDATTIFFYLTYLYNKACPKPKILLSNDTAPFEAYVLTVVNDMYSGGNTSSLTDIVQQLLNKLEYFPDTAAPLSRTSIFLLCFIIMDGTWIVSAVALLMGTSFGIKGSLSLVFFGPWLVMTVCICVFDAVASVLFGFDIASTINFSGWISFVGILDSSQFADFLSKNPSDIFSVTPSLVFCSISSRFILIWISNWIGFILVLRATVSVCRESYKNETQNRPRSRNFVDSQRHRNRVDQNTSADRIRNWQLFYGAIDTTRSSTHSNKSGETENNLTSNSVESGLSETPSTPGSAGASNCYYAYPDIAESVVMAEGGRCLEELRGQLPWSYTKPQEEGRGRCKVEETIELESRAKRHLRIKSDSSGSGTEL